jgi:DNA-entry nuclease
MVPAYSGKAYVAINNNTPFFKENDITDKSYEFYSELDALGRCGECIAVIGTDIMPTEDRGSIGNVKPSGWNQNKYAGLVDGNYLYNRCHLIGYQLTGENANTKNLITGTRYLNIEGMLPFENMVADYVKETNNHVLFRVTPIFEGNNLLASGVLMEAMSVEDRGEGILFCVYSYNMQPGIGINYYDGSNYLLEEVAPTVAPTEAPTTEAPTEPPTEAPPLSAGYCYKTATGSKYHSINDCGNTNPNKTTRITIEEAINMGLDACKKCW